MALVAIDAVVYIAPDTLMVGVGLRLCVAIRALEYRIIVGIRMTGRTHPAGVAMIDWKLCVLGMVKAGI